MLEVLVRLPVDGSYSYEFATLTYHESGGGGPSVWRRHVAELGRRLVVDWGDIYTGMFWRRQWQKRGVVHLHLLLQSSRPFGRLIRPWIAREWNSIVEPGDEKHAAVGTSCDPVRMDDRGSMRKLVWYLANYMSKREQDRPLDKTTGEVMETGRMWGRNSTIVISAYKTFTLTEAGRVILARRLRRWGKGSRYISRIGKRYKGCLVFGDPLALMQLLRGLVPDSELAAVGSRIRGP